MVAGVWACRGIAAEPLLGSDRQGYRRMSGINKAADHGKPLGIYARGFVTCEDWLAVERRQPRTCRRPYHPEGQPHYEPSHEVCRKGPDHELMVQSRGHQCLLFWGNWSAN